jgi:hypothetical protein
MMERNERISEQSDSFWIQVLYVIKFTSTVEVPCLIQTLNGWRFRGHFGARGEGRVANRPTELAEAIFR